jgi:hypothetical protein
MRTTWLRLFAAANRTDATAGLGALADSQRGTRAAWPMIAVGILTLLLLLLPLARMGMTLEIDFGEGWNAYVTEGVLRGEPVYRPLASLAPNNYPPLSFHVMALLHRISGWPVLPLGRLVALLSLLVVALEVGVGARLCGATRPDAALAGLLFVGLVASGAARYVAMNDPQLLAHAIAEPALLVFLRWPVGRIPATTPVVAALVAAALFTKHNLVALPVALTLAVWLDAPGRLLPWCLTLGGVMTVTAAVLERSTGGLFLASLLMKRRYELAGLLKISGIGLLTMLAPAAVTALDASRGWIEPRLRLVFLYALAATAIGIAFSGGSGADVNMFFSAFVAVSIACGATLTRLRAWPGMFHAAAAVVVAWLALALPLRLLTPGRHALLRARERATIDDVRFLRAYPGDAFCERMLLCYLAGKPLVLQPYFAPELAATGDLPEAAVRQPFNDREFGVVQLDRRIPGPGDGTLGGPRARLPPGVLTSIERRYRLARVSLNGAFYVPAD